MKVGRWAPVLLVVFGVAAACHNDSETNWSEPVGGTTSLGGGGAGNPNQVGGAGKGGAGIGGNPIGGASGAGTSGAGGTTEPRGGAAGSPSAGAAGDGGASGAGGEGGAGAAGAPTDPEGGAGGAEGAGGNGGEGGEEPSQCEDDSGVPTVLPSCGATSAEAEDSCQNCLKASCCTEWQHCYGTSPQSKCGHGEKEEEPGELECLHQCYLSGLATSVDSLELLQACASTCAGACIVLAQPTNDLVDCALNECLDECLPAE